MMKYLNFRNFRFKKIYCRFLHVELLKIHPHTKTRCNLFTKITNLMNDEHLASFPQEGLEAKFTYAIMFKIE